MKTSSTKYHPSFITIFVSGGYRSPRFPERVNLATRLSEGGVSMRRKAVLMVLLLAVMCFVAVFAETTDREALRMELAKKYANAKPGERFAIGYITWGLAQEYLMICWQAVEQACRQLGLDFIGAVAETDAAWIETTENMIAAGAKAIIYNCPSAAVMPELTRICNENRVFMATFFGYTGDFLPGDLGPYWVLDNTPLSDEQTYFPLMILFEKMKQNGKTKLLHHQASKTVATVSTVYINLGVFMAWKHYPEIQVLGHQYGEWTYEGGRKAAQASLAIRRDYEALWGANDSQTMGALRVLEENGLKIGPFTASRDMEYSTALEILKGNFLCTSGFDIPYFAGRMVPMLYDMCVGAWYPLPEEMIQAPRLTVYGKLEEIEPLARAAGIIDHPSFAMVDPGEYFEKILAEMKKEKPNYPFDFRLMSIAKCKELGLTYDKHAGAEKFGIRHLGRFDYYYPVLSPRFGSLEAFRAHVKALHEYFLDFSWADTWEEAEEYAKQFPPELKLEPVW